MVFKEMETLSCETCHRPTFCCSCESSFKSFDNVLSSRCSGGVINNVKFSNINISTMTVCFNFNQPLNLQLLKTVLHEKLAVSYNPGSRKSKVKKKKGTDSFYNSFDIKLTFVDRSVEPVIFSNVSIFIFPNGKVKAAGIQTINTIKVMVDELIETIRYIDGPVVEDVNKLDIENVKIQMICSDFKIKPLTPEPDGWCLKQEDLKNILVKQGYSATFSALSRYPGINLKFPSRIEHGKQISLLIFRSGSIIITGAKYPEDIAESYVFITGLIAANNEIFYYDINEEIKQRKKRNKNVVKK